MQEHEYRDIVHRLQRVEGKVDGIISFGIASRLASIEDKGDKILVALSQQEEFLMALADDLKAAIAKVDAETTDVGTLVASLASRIKNSMTDQEVADIKAAFTAVSDRLTTLAVDPTNPVPPPTPQLQKARKLAGP